jgi:hypothetical protein
MMPATVKITPIIWIKKMLATKGFYQRQAYILKAAREVAPCAINLGYKCRNWIANGYPQKGINGIPVQSNYYWSIYGLR